MTFFTMVRENLIIMYSQRKSLKPDHFLFAECVDCAFSLQDQAKFVTLADTDAPLPWIPADVLRCGYIGSDHGNQIK